MHRPSQPRHQPHARRTHVRRFVFIFLVIEFLDEFVVGTREAAWPLIRADLGLTYVQVGLLLGIPSIVGNLIEPFLAILGDVWRRHVLVLGGGAVFALCCSLPHWPRLRAVTGLLRPLLPGIGRLRQPVTGDVDGSPAVTPRAEHVAVGPCGVGRRGRRIVGARCGGFLRL